MSETSLIADEFRKLADTVCERLSANKRVRRNLPGEGRIKVDRQLPFLCLYRSPSDRDDTGSRELVTTEASYIFASGDPIYHEGLSHLCREIDTTMREHFGAFLVIEVWAEERQPPQPSANDPPVFRVITSDADLLPTAVEALKGALSEPDASGRSSEVLVETAGEVAPPGMAPLIFPTGGTFTLGLEVQPIYRDAEAGLLFPMVLQRLRRRLGNAIRRTVFAFTDTGIDPDAHYEALGPTALSRAAREADDQLCRIASSFDFLLQVTPTNSAEAWKEFQESGFRSEPVFHYRPLPYHPKLIKRSLFDVPVERIEDTTLAHLCSEKQDELDRQLTALHDLDTPNFKYTSLQIYGGADDWLVGLARDLLNRFPAEPNESNREPIGPAKVVKRAEQEIDYYRRRMPEFAAAEVVSSDVAAGLMVSQGRLLVAESLRLRPERIEPLMHHEVGTHLLTYFNGKRQPFGQLYVGLAGYEPLQEGLAVFAEYLVGGLTAARWRSLASRVIAVQMMSEGESFLEVFDHLHRQLGFGARAAFMTSLRVFRGGGLTKDAIYLRGLCELLDYLKAEHDLEPLYVGKIGLHHVPYVRELRRRGVLEPPGALPRFWSDRGLRDRLDACRQFNLLQLAEQRL